MGVVGFTILFVVLMIPWFAMPGAIAAGLTGAVAALFGCNTAHRHIDQARRFYEEARMREDQEHLTDRQGDGRPRRFD